MLHHIDDIFVTCAVLLNLKPKPIQEKSYEDLLLSQKHILNHP